MSRYMMFIIHSEDYRQRSVPRWLTVPVEPFVRESAS
jgi:hypothetical protein